MLTDIKSCSVWTTFAPIKHYTVTVSLLLLYIFALYKCELIKKISASLYNISQHISKYASDIDHSVTFSSQEGKQYQIE